MKLLMENWANFLSEVTVGVKTGLSVSEAEKILRLSEIGEHGMVAMFLDSYADIGIFSSDIYYVAKELRKIYRNKKSEFKWKAISVNGKVNYWKTRKEKTKRKHAENPSIKGWARKLKKAQEKLKNFEEQQTKIHKQMKIYDEILEIIEKDLKTQGLEEY